MALQTSGQISLNDIHVEAGGSSGSLVGINDADVRGLIGKSSGAQMSFSEWYGASSVAFDAGSQSFPSGTNTITATNATYYEMAATSSSGISFTLTNVNSGGEIWFAMVGASGGKNAPYNHPPNQYKKGRGGVGICKITVPSGVSTLTVKVGGQGNFGTYRGPATGGSPGGGDSGEGAFNGTDSGSNSAAAGGGYTAVFSGTTINQSNCLAIVGGGGGICSQPYSGHRGHGGGFNQNGTITLGGGNTIAARGATTTAGGAGGTYNDSTKAAGSSGSALQGGAGGDSVYEGGAGGGGGYYGGGGGSGGSGYDAGAGGGGSGYANTTYASNISNGSVYDGDDYDSDAYAHYKSQLQTLISSALGDSISLTKNHGGPHGGLIIALAN